MDILSKTMDSFGTWRIWKFIFFFVNATIYRVVWTTNALLTVCSFHFERQNVQSPPEHFAIGYVHNDNLPQGNIALQYVIPNKCRKVWWCFLNFLHFLKIKNTSCRIHQNCLVASKRQIRIQIWQLRPKKKFHWNTQHVTNYIIITWNEPQAYIKLSQ